MRTILPQVSAGDFFPADLFRGGVSGSGPSTDSRKSNG
jgi:hypothetical protein